MRDLICVFDAGSTGTRFIIYEKKDEVIHLIRRVKYPVILSSQKIENIFKYLNSIIEKAAIIEFINENLKYVFFATESMRRLPIKKQQVVLEKIQQFFKINNFSYEKNDVRILSGEEEAMSSYGAVKYLLNLQNKFFDLIELGGGSMQIVNENNKISIKDFGFAEGKREIFLKHIIEKTKNYKSILRGRKNNLLILIGFFYDFFPDFKGKFKELKKKDKFQENKIILKLLNFLEIEEDREIYVLKKINGVYAEWSFFEALKKFN